MAKTRRGGNIRTWMLPDYSPEEHYLENFYRCHKAKVYSYRCKFTKNYGNKGYLIQDEANKASLKTLMLQTIKLYLKDPSVKNKLCPNHAGRICDLSSKDGLDFLKIIANQIYVITFKKDNKYGQQILLKSDYDKNKVWYKRYWNKVVKTAYPYLTDENKEDYLKFITTFITRVYPNNQGLLTRMSKTLIGDSQKTSEPSQHGRNDKDTVSPLHQNFPTSSNGVPAAPPPPPPRQSHPPKESVPSPRTKTPLPSKLPKESVPSPATKTPRPSTPPKESVPSPRTKTHAPVEESPSKETTESLASLIEKNIDTIVSHTPVIVGELTIQIDNIQFTLICKLFGERYTQVGILGHDGTTYSFFWVYPSKSELGLWRLAGRYQGAWDKLTDERGKYKNYHLGDYVQTTLVHLDLQKFINEHIENIEIVTSDVSPEITDKLNRTMIQRDDYKLITPYPLNRLQLHMFDTFSEGNNKSVFDPLERAIHDPNNLRYPFPFVFMSLVKPEIWSRRYDFQCGHPVDLDRLNRFSEILSEIYDVSFVDDGVDYTNSFENIINVTGKIYKVVLTQKSEINPAYLTFDINDYEMDESKPEKILKVNPQTDILPSVILYFMKVSMVCSNIESVKYRPFTIKRICKKEKHFMPIFLTIPEAKVNLFGIYDKYINAGNYICKLFDYKKQCQSSEHKYQCTPGSDDSVGYVYVGTRYDNLFPYNILNLG